MAAIAKLRIMPLSVETNLSKLMVDAKKLILNSGGKIPRFEEEPIAFGLKALNATFLWSEEKELETLEMGIREIRGVKSVELVDIRKAIG